ncbi:MAG: lipoate--protein ligase family protein [Miltoncostaeaceae bacterium]
MERERAVALPATAAVARAVDLLASAADTGAPATAWTVADPPALVLGRSARDPRYDAEACRAEGVEVARRVSGGGPLLWDADLLGLDVALPPGHTLAGTDVVLAYRWLGEAIGRALATVGVEQIRLVEIHEARAAPRDEVAEACFGGLSPYEILARERKVVGLSQVRRRTGTLLQAGIALRFDAARLARLMGRDADFAALLRERAAGLDELGAKVDAEDVTAAVDAEVARCLNRDGLQGD